MEKEQPSRNWTTNETNFFSEILADPVNNSMETLERDALKKHSAVNYLIHLFLNLWQKLLFGQFCYSTLFPLSTMLRNNEQNLREAMLRVRNIV